MTTKSPRGSLIDIDNQPEEAPDPYSSSELSKIKDKPQWIHTLVDKEDIYESPVNINLSKTIPLEIPPLTWHHHDLPPKKMKLTNTGHTLILSAKWLQERPFLSDGPLLGNYVFSQLHFHWGSNDMEGSEHTVDGGQQPLEMHVVHFKSCYLTQEAALKEKDGIAVLTYFFKLQGSPNPAIQFLMDAVPLIQKPHCSARLDPLPLSFLVRPFSADYFLYWGSVTTSTCIHLILWLISRVPIGISAEQLEQFRSMMDANEEPLIRNFRTIQPLNNRKIFHISPSTSKYSTLLPIAIDVEVNTIPISKNPRPLISEEPQQIARAEIYCQTPFRSNTRRYCNPVEDTRKTHCQHGRHNSRESSSDSSNQFCSDVSDDHSSGSH